MPASLEKVIHLLAKVLDETLNPATGSGAQARKTAFILLVFPSGKWGRCTYIDNGINQGNVAAIFRELATQADERAARKDGPGGVM